MSTFPNTGGSHLSQIFWEHENLSGLSVIWLISTLNYTKKFWQKTWAKQESGLTTVQCKWDTPVEDQRQVVDTVKRILMKEKIDGQLAGQTSSTPL